ncbi:hypothetical protein RIVM261_033090 [Rivularia sp. IAM M-261]|nr:hypothetical protein CAL7716_093000 [Calothrix sp. PCC 7716]GJD18353.1 hypothetical protein RIVM261_033090 [Rivularia sp. IAM M-261]
MSSIIISDLNQDSIITDLSEEQINAIQGGIHPAVVVVAAIFLIGVAVGLSGEDCSC